MAEQNTIIKCKFEDCLSQSKTRGYCTKHYKKLIRQGKLEFVQKNVYDPICIVDDCNSLQEKKGYCQKHYRRIQRHGTLDLTRQPKGSLVSCGEYLTINIDGVKKLHHVFIAEKALGKSLPDKAEVHHINEIKNDNRPENLVICPDRAYHMILHARQRAYDACGNANWMKCMYCKMYDDVKNGSTYSSRGDSVNCFYHKSCAADYVKKRKAIKKINKI